MQVERLKNKVNSFLRNPSKMVVDEFTFGFSYLLANFQGYHSLDEHHSILYWLDTGSISNLHLTKSGLLKFLRELNYTDYGNVLKLYSSIRGKNKLGQFSNKTILTKLNKQLKKSKPNDRELKMSFINWFDEKILNFVGNEKLLEMKFREQIHEWNNTVRENLTNSFGSQFENTGFDPLQIPSKAIKNTTGLSSESEEETLVLKESNNRKQKTKKEFSKSLLDLIKECNNGNDDVFHVVIELLLKKNPKTGLPFVEKQGEYYRWFQVPNSGWQQYMAGLIHTLMLNKWLRIGYSAPELVHALSFSFDAKPNVKWFKSIFSNPPKEEYIEPFLSIPIKSFK